MYNRPSGGSSAHLNRGLEIAALEAVKRSIARKCEPFQHRKAARERNRHVFQSFFHRCFRFRETALITTGLRLAGFDEQGDNHDRQERTNKSSAPLAGRNAPIQHVSVNHGFPLHGSDSSESRKTQPCCPPRVSTPYQYGVEIRMRTSVPVVSAVRVLAVWNGADLSGAPGDFTSRSTCCRRSCTCCSRVT